MIYVLEDDNSILELILYALKSQNIEAKGFSEPLALQEAIKEEIPQILILDVMLPGISGFEILREIKNSEKTKGIAVLMLSALNSELDKVKGLDCGADDYITKPYSARELTARVKAILRRASAAMNQTEHKADTGIITSGDVTINIDRYEVRKNGKTVDITLREFELLKFLAVAPDQIFSREVLLENVWGYEYLGDVRTVDVTIRRLREKIEDDPSMPRYIMTKRSIGYYFNKI